VKVSPFYICIQIDRKLIRLKVEQLSLTLTQEEFVVTARNGSLVFKSNRPLLRGKGIKKRDADFIILEGKLKHGSYEREIIKEIINHVDQVEKDRVAITFEHRGRIFSGHFARVMGSGDTSTWHLNSDDSRYLGRLRKDSNDDWVFDGSSPKDELQYLAQFFGNCVTVNLKR